MPLSHTVDRVQRNPLTMCLLIHIPKPMVLKQIQQDTLQLLGACLAVFFLPMLEGDANELVFAA